MAQHLKPAGNGAINTYSHNCGGFSFLEVMLSVVILTISLLGVAGMYGFSSHFSYEAKQYCLAVNISKHVLDGVKINKKAWVKLFNMDEGNKKIKVIINDKISDNEIKLDQTSPVVIDIQSFRQHLINSFPNSNACILIEISNEDVSNIINLNLNVNWRVDKKANSSDICHVYQSEQTNKNYNVSAVL